MTHEDKIQALMDDFYHEWQKEANKGKSKWDVLGGLSEAHQIAVVFGNFNYQVGNGGIDQWISNGYFNEDSEKFIEYLEAGAGMDDRCRSILDRVYKLDQYAEETDCDRYGSYYDSDNDGDSGFIGDMIDGDAFDTWYYKHCDKDDWWQTVWGIIEKIAPIRPLQAYIENIHNEEAGSFVLPLPTGPDELKGFLEASKIGGWQDAEIIEIKSDVFGLGKALTETLRKSMSPNTLDELNYLAARLGGLSENGSVTFFAAVEAGRHNGSIPELINLSSPENLSIFDIQPAYSAEQYGDHLLDMQKDDTVEIFRGLENSENPDERAFAQYVLRLEARIDPAAFGRGAAEEENGAFTSHGYLTEAESKFQTIYHGSQDIPDEFRIFTKPDEIVRPLMKLAGMNIAETLAKLYAVTCGGNTGVAEELKRLDETLSTDYVLIVNKDRFSVFSAYDIYKGEGIAAMTIKHWAQPGTSYYAIRMDAHADDGNKGDFVELNTDALLSSIKRHTVSPDRIDAARHDGFSRSYDPASWTEVTNSQKHEIKSIIPHYPADDLEDAARRFSSLVYASEAISDTVGTDAFLPVAGIAFMADAENPQPDMIRVNNDAAREMLARGDAEVYRLTTAGAEKLAVIESMKPMCFAQNRDLAIRREDVGGLDKWAERDIKNIQRQAERAERRAEKNKGEEL